jgi:hypothetical protein
MKLAFALAISLVLLSSVASAQTCAGVRLTRPQVITFVSGQLVCAYKAGSPASDPNTRWSEEHRQADSSPTGELWEYGGGTGSPVDPPEEVGTWNVPPALGTQAGDWVNYSYDGAGTYSFSLYNNNGTTLFCDKEGNNLVATVWSSSVIPANKADPDPCGWSGAP